MAKIFLFKYSEKNNIMYLCSIVIRGILKRVAGCFVSISFEGNPVAHCRVCVICILKCGNFLSFLITTPATQPRPHIKPCLRSLLLNTACIHSMIVMLQRLCYEMPTSSICCPRLYRGCKVNMQWSGEGHLCSFHLEDNFARPKFTPAADWAAG